MKNFKFVFFVALIATVMLGLQSFGPKNAVSTSNEGIDMNEITEADGLVTDIQLAGPNTFAPYLYKKAAQTADSTNNYLDELPVLFTKSYTICVQGTRTNVSGTTNLKVWLEQSCNTGNPLTTTQTDWLAVDSASTTGATAWAIQRQFAAGSAYRLRWRGTVAQRNTISYWFVIKPTPSY